MRWLASKLLVTLLFIAIPTPFLNSKFIFTSSCSCIVISNTILVYTVQLFQNDRSHVPYSRKFSRELNFTVFADFLHTSKIKPRIFEATVDLEI